MKTTIKLIIRQLCFGIPGKSKPCSLNTVIHFPLSFPDVNTQKAEEKDIFATAERRGKREERLNDKNAEGISNHCAPSEERPVHACMSSSSSSSLQVLQIMAQWDGMQGTNRKGMRKGLQLMRVGGINNEREFLQHFSPSREKGRT